MLREFNKEMAVATQRTAILSANSIQELNILLQKNEDHAVIRSISAVTFVRKGIEGTIGFTEEYMVSVTF